MIKMTIFMQTDNYTWTESYYAAGSIGQDLDSKALTVGQFRAQLMGSGAAVVAIRLIDTTKPRNSYYVGLGGLTLTPANLSYLLPDVYADRPYSSVLVKFTDAAGYTKSVYFSGCPDILIGEVPVNQRGIEQFISPAWVTRLQAWTQAMSQGKWGWLRQSNPTPRIPIQQIVTQPAAPNQLGIQTLNPLTFTASQAVIITGYRRLNTRVPGMSGRWSVDPLSPALQAGAVAPWVYYLLGTPLTAGQSTNHSGPGYVAPVNPTLSLLQDGVADPYSFDVLAATHRKRGASALAPRGRLKMRR